MDHLVNRWSRHLLDNAKADCSFHGFDKLKLEKGVPYIFMSNHISVFDIPAALLSSICSVRMIAKKEMSRYPFMGAAMVAGEFIFIDRKNIKNAIKDLDRAKKQMQSGTRIWVFPEGTRSNSNEVKAFKKGPFHLAIELGAVVIPVGIKGTNKILAPHSLNISFEEKVDLYVGEAIQASEYSKDNINELLNETRQRIKSLVA